MHPDLLTLAHVPLGPTLSLDSASALSRELTAEISEFCDHLEDAAEPSVALIRLTGSATAPDWPGPVTIELVTRWEKALRRLERLPTTTVAVATGLCGGPALEVLLTADYRIGARGLRVELPIRDESVWAGMIIHRLVGQTGAGPARHLVLFGGELTAEQSSALGLIDETADDPDSAVRRAVRRVGRLAPAELAVRRRLLLDGGTTSHEEMLSLHLAACDRALRRRAGNTDAAVDGPRGAEPARPPSGASVSSAVRA